MTDARKALAGLLIRAAHRIYRPTVAELAEGFTLVACSGKGSTTKFIPFSALRREADGSFAPISVVVGAGGGGGGGGYYSPPDDGPVPAVSR